jgi:hypothetical protein
MNVQRSIRRLCFVLGVATGLVACEETVGPREAATWGAIRVRVLTEGTRLNPEDYRVSLDSAIQGYGIARTVSAHLRHLPADSVDFSPVITGAHRVTLLGVSSNCVVALGSTRVVRLRPDELLAIEYDVTCVSPP